MERRADSDLKKGVLYSRGSLQASCCPNFCSKGCKVWYSNVELALGSQCEEEAVSTSLQGLKLAAEYMAEAAIDLVRFVSQIMAHSVTAKWALRLKHWSADSASKHGLCSIPFSGGTLFGKTLEDEIHRVTGGKAGFLPTVLSQKQETSRAVQRRILPPR